MSNKFFDDNKSYKFRNLQNRGVVRDRDDLKEKQRFGFPSGRLLTPRDRQWTGLELNEYFATRPTTQEEFAALADRPPPSTVIIPKKAKKSPDEKSGARTQAEFDARTDRPSPSTVIIPKSKKKAERATA